MLNIKFGWLGFCNFWIFIEKFVTLGFLSKSFSFQSQFQILIFIKSQNFLKKKKENESNVREKAIEYIIYSESLFN